VQESSSDVKLVATVTHF